MAYFTSDVVKAVEQVARIYYIDAGQRDLWNRNRRHKDELKLLCGWCWMSKKNSKQHQQGLKTISAAYRDAYYVLVQHAKTPAVGETRTRATA